MVFRRGFLMSQLIRSWRYTLLARTVSIEQGYMHLRCPKYSTKFFLSDAVSCKANLAQLSREQRNALAVSMRDSRSTVYGIGEKRPLNTLRDEDGDKYGTFIRKFNGDAVVIRLVHSIKEEKAYFENSIDPIDLLRIDAVLPKKSNAKIAAQSGAFLIFGLIKEIKNESSSAIKMHKIDINQNAKDAIIKSLAAVGIHQNSVYPELDKIGSRIRGRYQDPPIVLPEIEL